MWIADYLRSLPVRLTALLALALLPLGAVSIHQTYVVMEEAQALNRAALLNRTKAAASAERELIREAIGSARVLGSLAATADLETCHAVMRQFVEVDPLIIFAGAIGADGTLNCATRGTGLDFSDDPILRDLFINPRTFIETNASGSVTGQEVVIVNEPYWKNGALGGFVSVSVPLDQARARLPDPGPEGGLKLALINADGKVIAATRGAEAAAQFLPADRALGEMAGAAEQTFMAQAGDGSMRFFAVAPIVPGTVFILGSWPRNLLAEAQPIWRFVALGFPILMGFAGLIVGYFGVSYLVIRHVDRLKSAMRRFALGEMGSEDLDLGEAPQELKDAERAFNRMKSILVEADARLGQELEDKKILLREVHHRVKNNLQLIASIMNMQMRSAETEEAAELLGGLQARVRGLALLHRTLYATGDMAAVDTDKVLTTLADEIEELAQARREGAIVEIDAISVKLLPDQAVPLSMLASEALTNAVKYFGAPDGEKPRIRLELRNDEASENPDALVLEITNSMGPDRAVDLAAGSGLGARLIKAFALQIGGRIEQGLEGDIYRLRLDFQRALEVEDD